MPRAAQILGGIVCSDCSGAFFFGHPNHSNAGVCVRMKEKLSSSKIQKVMMRLDGIRHGAQGGTPSKSAPGPLVYTLNLIIAPKNSHKDKTENSHQRLG